MLSTDLHNFCLDKRKLMPCSPPSTLGHHHVFSVKSPWQSVPRCVHKNNEGHGKCEGLFSKPTRSESLTPQRFCAHLLFSLQHPHCTRMASVTSRPGPHPRLHLFLGISLLSLEKQTVGGALRNMNTI